MTSSPSHWRVALGIVLIYLMAVGCWTPADYRKDADRAALSIIESTYRRALGTEADFTIDRPAWTLRRRLLVDQELPVTGPGSYGTASLDPVDYWPEDLSPAGPREEAAGGSPIGPRDLELTLVDSLSIAAQNSRDYQSRKEDVFRAALDLDLARDEFRTTFTGLLSGSLDSTLTSEPRTRVTGLEGTGSLDVTRMFQNGVTLSSMIGLDVVRLLTTERNTSQGLFWDSSISIPLMRGSGRHIVAEPLIQAERDVLYAILEFERFKRTFAVQISRSFLEVLQQMDQVNNAEQNYRSLIASGRQLRRLADAGRRPELEVDQAHHDELRARDRWITAIQALKRQMDSFRIELGLPTDASVLLNRSELERVSSKVRAMLAVAADPEQIAENEAAASVDADTPITLPEPGIGRSGPFEIDPVLAVRIALEKRRDLAVSQGRVYDAQRAVVVAADALRTEVTLLGTSSLGEHRTLGGAALPDSTRLRYNDATYEALLSIDLPLERTAERNAYRDSWIQLEREVRSLQELEDQVKQEVRNQLRSLLQSREGQTIQATAVRLAERRVNSARLFLDAGRAQTRDLLEAQEDLVVAQNDLTAALIAYRIAELELQRDLGLLEITTDGLWQETDHRELETKPGA